MPTQRLSLLNLAEPLNLKGLPDLPALHAHTKYTPGVQLCLGIDSHQNTAGLRLCRIHTSTTVKARGCAPSNPTMGRDTALVHSSVCMF